MDHLKSKVCLRPAFILSKLVCCARRMHTSLITPYSLTESSPHCRSSIRKPYTRHAPLHPVPRTVHITVSVISQDRVALDIAGMLLAPPASSKSETFILHCSAGRHVPITRQRGPLYAVSITQKLRKLTALTPEPPFPSHSRRNPAFCSPCNKAPPATTTLTTPPPSVAGTRSRFPFFYVCRRASQRGRTASRVLCSIRGVCPGAAGATSLLRNDHVPALGAPHGYLRGVP